jgi:hypothetical protein
MTLLLSAPNASGQHPVRTTILNNDPVEEKLHVIMVVSNPANFESRFRLAREFIHRMRQEKDIELYVVELCYGEQQFKITQKANPKHLQLHTNAVLWHKENMVNMAVRHLLPSSWRAMAWIDADLAFENVTWARDTLKILNGAYDVVQLFSHACDMDARGYNMNVFTSFGYCWVHGIRGGTGPNYPHPGYAWAITRRTYERTGGLFQEAVLGSGDYIMAKAFTGDVLSALPPGVADGYKQQFVDYGARASMVRLGYVPGVIRHFFHGSKKNRKYQERSLLLSKWMFDPIKHLEYRADGLMKPNKSCPQGFLDDIMDYSRERQEDDTE